MNNNVLISGAGRWVEVEEGTERIYGDGKILNLKSF